ncbi:GMC oxidoreductase-domain-containing protein [Mycena rosella]|uniref:GMC oxidoreductase-domain-containing protein n=1 Tax=Mycena rosella TaxID=1033263 RepID=A0AAD7C355_MYCRO|nr:GMC oxidoreductase-domain-containing protein [Mycena rosella]
MAYLTCKWANSGTVPLKASGVEFASSTNSTARFAALARCETPALLMLSGIGDSAVLGPLGIKTEIHLKTVGRNLQEQASAKVSQIQSFGTNLPFLLCALLPFSRGNVKITSADPFTAPAIRANYFSVGLDLDVQVAGMRLSRRILTSPPLNSLSVGETAPGSKVPDDAARGSDAAGQTWIKNGFASVAHPIGTAAMMRRSLGGVVDAQLKVYDTANVHVVDASVVPLQLSAHLFSTLYVAEKAADLIKAAQ